MNEITKRQMVIKLRGGIEYTVREDRAKVLQEKLMQGAKGFADVDGRSVNLADISGVHYPEDIAVMKNERDGQKQCRYGKWHPRGQNCDCGSGGSSLPLYHWEGGRKFIDGVEQVDSSLDHRAGEIFDSAPFSGKEQMVKGLQKFLDENPNSPKAFEMLVKWEKNLDFAKMKEAIS